MTLPHLNPPRSRPQACAPRHRPAAFRVPRPPAALPPDTFVEYFSRPLAREVKASTLTGRHLRELQLDVLDRIQEFWQSTAYFPSDERGCRRANADKKEDAVAGSIGAETGSSRNRRRPSVPSPGRRPPDAGGGAAGGS